MKVLNFGSLNYDYVYEVDHAVMPGETIDSTKMEVFCGGKGLNQSIALARAGVPVYHAGQVGEDGQMFPGLLLQPEGFPRFGIHEPASFLNMKRQQTF